MENILNKIIKIKKETIKKTKKIFTEEKILNNIKELDSFVDFKAKMKKINSEKKISIIAEVKKASPSAGEIVKNFNPLEIAKTYHENGASFLSIVTEEKFFLGKLDYIKNIKDHLKIPVLCKDFFIDPYQVALAKSFGADCILIILSAVDKVLAKDLYQTANDLNITSIVEVHSENEADNALYFEDSLIGINNRNLQTLEVSLDTSVRLSKILISHKNPLISESGIINSSNIKYIIEKTNISNFLIGESLLKSENIALKLRELSQITL